MRLSKDKKGVELTLQTVIIAVLVLIVLVVLLYILFKGISGFGGATGCVDRGGECVGDAESCRASGGSVYSMGSCPQGLKCCMYPNNLFRQDENEY